MLLYTFHPKNHRPNHSSIDHAQRRPNPQPAMPCHSHRHPTSDTLQPLPPDDAAWEWYFQAEERGIPWSTDDVNSNTRKIVQICSERDASYVQIAWYVC
jgi:hypothetical protein